MGQKIESIGRLVLVVEDEAIIRMSAVSLVEEHGFEAIEAGSADEAIEILEKHPEIRVVFTDIQMAGSMDGLQLAAYAKNRWPPLKFIIVSGERKPGKDELPLDSIFFAKPYDIGTIRETLSQFFA